MRRTKRSNTRCLHVQHKPSSINYHLKDKSVQVSVVLGFNRTSHRYEMCDEGFAEYVKVKGNAH